MDDREIYERLRNVFRDVFDDESIVLHPEFSSNELPAWDSLMHLRLLLTVEKSFNLRFSTSELGSLNNVRELVSVIRMRGAGASAPPGNGAAGMHDNHFLVTG